MDLVDSAENGDIDRVRELLDSGVDPYSQNDDELTALIVAAYEGHIEVVELLFNRGIDPNYQNDYGDIPLIYAATGHGQSDERVDIIKLLLDHGALLNLRDSYGVDALMAAAFNGHIEIVELLLNRGANPNIRAHSGDDEGNTALDIAENHGYHEIALLLRQYQTAIRIQRRYRHKYKTQKLQRKARQRSSLAKSMIYPSIYSEHMKYEPHIAENIARHLSRMSYNPEFHRRMREEEKRDREHLDWLQSYSHYW